MNNQNVKEFQQTITLQICDFILTPLSCASVINEIFKTFLYQKSQIPYTYNWLKTIISKKRKSEENKECTKQRNFTAQNHLRLVSNAYDTVEKIMFNICEHLKSSQDLKEIIFVIGATPFSPQEVFSVRINALNNGHNENNHVLECKKNQHKILRNIFLSEVWMDSSTKRLPCTKTYVFLKKILKDHTDHTGADEDSFFKPCQPLFLPSRTKHIVVDIQPDINAKFSCCSNLEIFNDVQTFPIVSNSGNDSNSTENCNEAWFQARIAIQGFKDCFIGQISASELW